MTIWSTARVWH